MLISLLGRKYGGSRCLWYCRQAKHEDSAHSVVFHVTIEGPEAVWPNATAGQQSPERKGKRSGKERKLILVESQEYICFA